MSNELIILTGTAASIGFFHTLLGPDHYLPFIFMAKARKWSMFKTTWVTIACGIGHVGSSIVLGSIGIIFGIAVGNLEIFEGVRGDIAAWAFVLFGLIYFIWGLRRAIINKPHKHRHIHKNGSIHVHEHTHINDHDHVHKTNITPWILFTIFVLGPCEPLIPFLMYPAVESSTAGLVLISLVFGLVTIATMLGVVLLATYGFNFVRFGKLERYSHALAGAIILLSGIGILFLGL
ncbi:MAG: sulfite exporter TauE/SafE family protein [Bacteroidetes bacterium]|nr:sulfite exporter TauE/SafE family protein [Bacteroidota bacterium]MBL7104140.1 sulfite exporter TauE/SafE family protein [Bacteroidales bacterium]